MILRPAAAADAELLSQAHALGFAPAWTAADIEALFGGAGVFGFLVIEADRPAGMLLARAVLDEAEILTIAVDPACRGRGVGRACVQAALDGARAAGASAVFLEVAVDNAPALALYARAGFRASGRRKGYYDRGGAGRVDAVVMRLDFAGPNA